MQKSDPLVGSRWLIWGGIVTGATTIWHKDIQSIVVICVPAAHSVWRGSFVRSFEFEDSGWCRCMCDERVVWRRRYRGNMFEKACHKVRVLALGRRRMSYTLKVA